MGRHSWRSPVLSHAPTRRCPHGRHRSSRGPLQTPCPGFPGLPRLPPSSLQPCCCCCGGGPVGLYENPASCLKKMFTSKATGVQGPAGLQVQLCSVKALYFTLGLVAPAKKKCMRADVLVLQGRQQIYGRACDLLLPAPIMHEHTLSKLSLPLLANLGLPSKGSQEAVGQGAQGHPEVSKQLPHLPCPLCFSRLCKQPGRAGCGGAPGMLQLPSETLGPSALLC